MTLYVVLQQANRALNLVCATQVFFLTRFYCCGFVVSADGLSSKCTTFELPEPLCNTPFSPHKVSLVERFFCVVHLFHLTRCP